MNTHACNRRDFLKGMGMTAAGLSIPVEQLLGDAALLAVDPAPRFELSPYLYMQFMEPLGVTDTSVDAAWDFVRHCWREDVIEATRELGATMIRWGGCFCSYYRWKEGVGPRAQRRPMVNLLWGGIYNNQVGTQELVDFCRRVDAEALICVNFESDGRQFWAKTPDGDIRSGGPEEAAEWVAYCNDPANETRIAHGFKAPLTVKFWQIGNETSYDTHGFDCETAAQRTLVFAKAMRAADPTIRIMGWADSGWAPRMVEVAGEELQYLAFHNHFGPGGEDSPLRGIEYRKDPARTWESLMRTHEAAGARVKEMREEAARFGIPFAVTEGHYGLPGRNRCEVLSTWAAGVSNARIMNMYERNGDIIKVATLADFCGTRWQNNAIMIPVPGGRSFMMPVAMVMSLYRHHTGAHALDVAQAPASLDVTASRTGSTVFLHAVNTDRKRPVETRLAVAGMKIAAGRGHVIALDPEYEVFEHRPDVTAPREAAIGPGGTFTFPAASVAAVELEVEPA